MHDPVFPNGCATCELEIDPDTGAISITRYASVDDVGRCINPLIVHGQTHGAIVQGIGQALWEQCYVEPDSGQPLIGSLMDYGLPRADAVPPFRTEIAEVLSPTNPLGIKAGGEGGTTAAPAVIVSAIVDALRDYGVRDIKMPATPYKIWQTIQDAKDAPKSAKAKGIREDMMLSGSSSRWHCCSSPALHWLKHHRRNRSRSWCPLRPEHRRTASRASSPTSSDRGSAGRWWSRTSRAPAARSA